MKNRNKIILLIVVNFLITTTVKATWITDNDYKFKIDVPSNWSKNSYLDGTDKVYDISNPDGTVAIQIRCFEVDASVTNSMLAQIFDEGLISDGATQLNYSNEELNGIPGVMAVYTSNYSGTDMGIVTFTSVKENLAYLIYVVVPVAQFDQKVEEADAVLSSFTLLKTDSQTVKQEEPQDPGTIAQTGGQSADNKMGIDLPEGKKWREGHWPKGKYNCGSNNLLGIIYITDDGISWTGAGVIGSNFVLPKGEGSWEKVLINNRGYDCYISLTHVWENSDGKLSIGTSLPSIQPGKVQMYVWTYATGGKTVFCTKSD